MCRVLGRPSLLALLVAGLVVAAATTVGLTGSASAAVPPTLGVPYSGAAFDTCSAPSLSAMAAWTASPYRAVGVYIGGVNRGCSQMNLTVGWVGSVVSSGWSLLPTYVGLQSPTISGCTRCARIDESQPLQQGVAAADDAVAQARALGIGPSSPIFYDMEAYDNTNQASVDATLGFLAAWTVRLHYYGYRSGVYSSASSGISDLVARAGTSFPEPDELWIAHWTGSYSTSDPYVPANLWVHQRAVQYEGNVTETYGGVTLNIDRDAIDAPLAASGAGPYVARTYVELLGRAVDPQGYRYWSDYLDFGGQRATFTGALAHSNEFTLHLIALDYEQVLHRQPDSVGSSWWAWQFAATGHGDRVMAGLAASAEYWNDAGGTATAFASALYRDLLGRAASDGEVEYWAGLLTRGTSRFTVALSIASSAEAVGDGVTAAYKAVVRTAPDTGGLAYWRNQIEQTGDPRPLLAALTASAAAWYG